MSPKRCLLPVRKTMPPRLRNRRTTLSKHYSRCVVFPCFSLGEQAWPKVFTCAKFMWQYKQLEVLPTSALIGKARVFSGFERRSQQSQRTYLQFTLENINSRSFSIDLQRHCWHCPGKKICTAITYNDSDLRLSLSVFMFQSHISTVTQWWNR